MMKTSGYRKPLILSSENGGIADLHNNGFYCQMHPSVEQGWQEVHRAGSKEDKGISLPNCSN